MGTFKFLKTNSKFGNIRTVYNGVVYQAKGEAKYAQELDLRIKAKDIKSYQTQVKFPVIINEVKVCDYVADFVIEHNDGTQEVIDCKGFDVRKNKYILTDVFKLKRKLVEAIYKIKIVLQGEEQKASGWARGFKSYRKF